MKQIQTFLCIGLAGLITVSACKKHQSDFATPAMPARSTAKGGSGSGSGSGGGTTTGSLQNVLSGLASRHVSGGSDSIFVSFTQPAPAGWALSVSSSNTAVQVPATYPVPQGAFNVYVPFSSSTVANTISIAISVSLGGQTKSTSISAFPRTATFQAPVLQSPSSGTKLKNRTIANFTSNTNNNAYYYQLQISDVSNFSTTETDVLLETPLWRQSAFSSYGTHYWRMRFVDGSGNGGPWSATRNFIVEP